MEDSLYTGEVDGWIVQNSKSKHAAAINRLKGLQLLLPYSAASK